MIITNLSTLILIILTFATIANSARNQTTDLFKKLLGRDAPVRSFSGYQDIDWYRIPSQASVYYSFFTSFDDLQLAKSTTPVIFYLAGSSPGMASQFTAFRQFGPYEIKKQGTGFKALQNPWAWNKFGHLVFLDHPVGTGFSYNYGKTVDGVTTAAQHFVNFLYNFLKDNFYRISSNPIYIAGDGFSGQILSTIKQVITQNKTLSIKIAGMILSNSFICVEEQINTYESFLLSTGMFASTTTNKVLDISNNVIKMIRNNVNGGEIKKEIDGIWKGNFFNGMDLYNYRYMASDIQGIDYIEMLNFYKKQFTVPDKVKYSETNPSIQSQFTTTIFQSYQRKLAAALNDEKTRFLIFSGQNNFISGAATTLEYMKNVPWMYQDKFIETGKQLWNEEGILRGWIKKYKNLVLVTLKNTGYYIYEDDTFGAKSAYLMIGNFINKKW